MSTTRIHWHNWNRNRGRRATLGAVLTATLSAALIAGPLGCRSTTPTNMPARASELREEVRWMIGAGRDRVFPALVNIQVVTVNYWGGKERKGSSVGSGTIISSDGYIITNQHVTTNGEKFKCTLADKREIDARLVGEDPLTDLAVLQLDLDQVRAAEGAAVDLPVAKWGDSAALEVGDYVLAMGSPFSLSRSVTLGIVSNVDRVFGGEFGGDEVEELQLDEGQRTGLFTNWIQHDAAINPGNSGGPLVNLKGEVVGVNELGGDQMGFAIPSNLARHVAESLILHGEVPRSTIGVSFKAIQRTGIERGALVNSIIKDGPAYDAGLRAGDIVTAIDGDPVNVVFLEEVPPLMKRIADCPVGSELSIAYLRDGQEHATRVITRKLEKDRGEETAFREWGITGMDITEKMARDRRLPSAAGVLISSIRSGGPAATAEPPLEWGDVIRTIEGKDVQDLADFVERYREIMAREPLPKYVLISFERNGQNEVTLVEPSPDKTPDAPREVRKAWIGIATQPVLKELAEHLGHPNEQGFRITRIYPRTRAADTALRVGDLIVKLNGEPVTPRGLQDTGLLARAVRQLDIDADATLTVWRDGGTVDVAVPLEATRLTVEEARRDRNDDFELTVRELTFFDRDDNQWGPDIEGVLVEQVESAGWAGLAGIQSGDLIQEIDGQQVSGLKSYRAIMERVQEQQPTRVVFVVLRDVRTHYQFVEPDWNPQAEDTEEK